MGLITRQYNYVSGQTIRSAEVNTNEATIYNEINGNLEDANIKNDTLTERVFTDNVNPLVRDADKYQSFIVSGLAVADASDALAKVSVSSGTVYTVYNGKSYRCVTSSETYSLGEVSAGTYYLFVDYTGTISHAASSTASDGQQLIAKIVVATSPYSVTVTDMRRMQLYDITNHYIHGCELACVSGNSNSITVSAGMIEIDSVFYRSTATTDPININTAANYIGGVAPATATWCYVYLTQAGISQTWEVKLSTTAPDKADTAGNSDGRAIYMTVGSTHYRCIGAVYRESDGSVRQFHQNDTFIQYDDFVPVSESVTADANIPEISTHGYFELRAYAINGQYGRAKLRPAGSGGDYFIVGWESPVAHEMHDAAYVECRTNDFQQVEVDVVIDNGIATCKTVGFWINAR